MQIIAHTSEKLNKEVKTAAEKCNISVSAFIKLAVTEHMNKIKQETKKEN